MSKVNDIEQKFKEYEKNISRLIEIKEELNSLETTDFDKEKEQIEKLLDSPENLKLVETKLKALKLKINATAKKKEKEITKVSKEDKKEFSNSSKNKMGVSLKEAKTYSELLRKIIDEIHHVVLGQDEEVQRIILCLMCDAHGLIEGVPGLAKSLLVEVLAKVIGETTFNRIQFLPDLLPSDIIGGQMYNPKTSSFKTFKGPIFANFVLADEINRAPPKTHAALMECMQEKKVTIDKDEFILDKPFFVLATQNPLENKGTYNLPEAILDRFMFKIILDYPDRETEKAIITNNATVNNLIRRKTNIIIDKRKFLEIQSKVKNVFISERIKDYIMNLVEATRGLNKNIEGFKFVKYGGGPRASIYLGIAAKAKALFEGRNYVLPDDVTFVAPDILRHRISLNYKGKAHNISSDKIIEEILMHVTSV